MYKLLAFLTFWLPLATTCFAQKAPTRYEIIYNTTDKYLRRDDYENAAKYINNLLNNKNISADDRLQCLYILSTLEDYKGNYRRSIAQQIAILKIKKTTTFQKDLHYLILFSIANSYFTLQDFEKSYYYAIRAEKGIAERKYHIYSTIHSIIGYCFYLKNDYKSALKEYSKIENNRYAKPCDAQAIINKKAKIYSKLKQLQIAEQLLKKSISLNKMCNDTNELCNTYSGMYEIYIENKMYKQATIIGEKVAELTDKINKAKRATEYDEQNIRFQTKTKEQENAFLKKSRNQIANLAQKQKSILIYLLLALLFMLALLYYVYKLNRKQKQTNIQLKRVHLLNQKIFNVISHDFKSPMLHLELFLKVESDTKINTKLFNENKLRIKNELKQANLILDNLLSWAKKELGITHLYADYSNVYTETQAVANQLNYFLKTKNITLLNDVPEAVNCNINPDILKIILRNLISNAIKFSFKNNNIIVGYSTKSNEFFVQDFGIGIADKNTDLLFKQQVTPRAGTDAELGYGLGLQFVNELILQNNGSIRVESTDNEGTTFYFKFK